MKKTQCVTVKLLAIVTALFCENNSYKEKTSCQLESRLVYVKKSTFRYNHLKPVLTKNGRGTSQWAMKL